MPKAARHRLIRQLIASTKVPSQDALAAMLADHGEHATQATISRDLRDLGVLKSSAGYQLPGPPAATSIASGPPGARGAGSPRSRGVQEHAGSRAGNARLSEPLTAAVRRFLASAETAATLVVLKTSPGHASVIAVELDRQPPSSAVGTVAGDDTIFVATRSNSDAASLADLFNETAGLRSGERRAG